MISDLNWSKMNSSVFFFFFFFLRLMHSFPRKLHPNHFGSISFWADSFWGDEIGTKKELYNLRPSHQKSRMDWKPKSNKNHLICSDQLFSMPQVPESGKFWTHTTDHVPTAKMWRNSSFFSNLAKLTLSSLRTFGNILEITLRTELSTLSTSVWVTDWI